MGNLAVNVENLGKQYKIFEEGQPLPDLARYHREYHAFALQDPAQPHRV